MKNLIILFIFWFGIVSTYGQKEAEQSLLGKTGPELISYDTINQPIILLDGLMITYKEYISLQFTNREKRNFKIQKKDYKETDNKFCKKEKKSVLLIYTKFLFVIDDKLLKTYNEKIKVLSSIEGKDTFMIKKIEKKEAINRFGKCGKYGAIEVKSNVQDFGVKNMEAF
jgi:hypothetical protein